MKLSSLVIAGAVLGSNKLAVNGNIQSTSDSITAYNGLSTSIGHVDFPGGHCYADSGGGASFYASGFGFNISYGFGNIISTYGGFEVQSGGSGGVILNSGATSWSAASDETLKTFTDDITDGLAKVSTIRAKIGYYNNARSRTLHPFLVPQDVELVLPQAVSAKAANAVDENDPLAGKLMLSYSDVVPLLVSALKDAKAHIDSLTARLAAVEVR